MRKDGKGQAKHRANVAAIVNEAFEIADPDDGHPILIRKSASETYDRSRTVNNKYTGYQTADDVLAALEEEADKQRVEVAVTDKKTGETVIHKRALPSTTVLGMAVIFNPPSEIAKDWSPEQYTRFFRDCEESLAQIPFGKINKKGELVGDVHYLFRRENIVASAEHWDEGEPMDPPIYTGHIHDIYKPEDLDGKYYGKFIDSFNLSYMVNRRFAGLMRDRGWDIDDPDYTDWEAFDKDKEYRAKRKPKIRTGGKSTNSYIASKKQKDAEVALTEAQKILDEAVELRRDAAAEVQAMKAQAEEEVQAAKKSAAREQEKARVFRIGAELDAKEIRRRADDEAKIIRNNARGDGKHEANLLIEHAKEDIEIMMDEASNKALVIRLEAEMEAKSILAEAVDAIAQAETEAELEAESIRDTALLEAEIEAAALLAESKAAAAKAGREKAEAELSRDQARREADEARQNQAMIQSSIDMLTCFRDDIKMRSRDWRRSAARPVRKPGQQRKTPVRLGAKLKNSVKTWQRRQPPKPKQQRLRSRERPASTGRVGWKRKSKQLKKL